VQGPGSFFTTRAGRTPIVVTRARDGVLRGFLNVCRHRGFPVADGAGSRETIQCPYHAWTYSLDGSLRSAPRSEELADFPREELGLCVISVDAWGPFVFANTSRNCEPLADALGSMPAQVAELGLDVDSLVHTSRWEAEVEANWKVVCENFLECYHCPIAHPGFSDMVDVSPDAYLLETAETFLTQRGPLRANGKHAYDPVGEVERSQFHFLLPNVGINVFPGPANLSIGPISPNGTGRTERYLDYFFAPDVDPGWREEFFVFDDQVGREDTVLVESVHRGMASGVLDHGRLLVNAEPLLAAFQSWVTESIR